MLPPAPRHQPAEPTGGRLTAGPIACDARLADDGTKYRAATGGLVLALSVAPFQAADYAQLCVLARESLDTDLIHFATRMLANLTGQEAIGGEE